MNRNKKKRDTKEERDTKTSPQRYKYKIEEYINEKEISN